MSKVVIAGNGAVGEAIRRQLKDTNCEDAEVVSDLVSFLKNFKDELWVCGGATIYKLSLPYADRLYISFIQGKHEGDAYFPKIDYSKYNLIFEKKTEQVRYTCFERNGS